MLRALCALALRQRSGRLVLRCAEGGSLALPHSTAPGRTPKVTIGYRCWGASHNDPGENRVPQKRESRAEPSTNIFGEGLAQLPSPVFHDRKHHLKIFQGDCLEILARVPEGCVDLIFADPPYFLSNNGITCHAGKMVSVNKGKWDKSRGADLDHEFNRAWLAACQRVLKPNGSIWVSGTSHVIHSVGFAMQQLGMKLLNDISWVKPNPPPNLSCRYFTHATETLIWAARDKKSRHTFNYKLMRELAGGKQMKSVWQMPAPERAEKRFGKHPTQKPVALLERILLAASNEGDVVLDPFMGSGTAAIAALRLRRRFRGIEVDPKWVEIAINRLEEKSQDGSEIAPKLGQVHLQLEARA